MKMMRSYGGQAIAVYQASNRAGVEDLLAKGRVDYIFQADYRAGSALEATVQDIIRKSTQFADNAPEEKVDIPPEELETPPDSKGACPI